MKFFKRTSFEPSAWASFIPVLFLIVTLVVIIIRYGADAVSSMSQMILLSAAAIALVISYAFYPRRFLSIKTGLRKSASQILPALPILLLIATMSATWMLGGIVPSLIYYGLSFLEPGTFLMLTCAVCSIISVLTGSSWTTCATIGVAFMGIGTVMGFSPGWVAGAVISGAYFGDKVSPLSDTTVLAASTSGVKMFDHIRYLMTTTIPAMGIALIVFLAKGLLTTDIAVTQETELMGALSATFNIAPWLMLAPVITCLLIVLRVNVLLTLGLSTILGLCGLFFTQFHIVPAILGVTSVDTAMCVEAVIRLLCVGTSIETHNALLNDLVATGGIEGMLGTIYLILSAMVFGGVMLGTGMLGAITRNTLRGLRRRRSIVPATIGTGFFMNCCSGDQYLSIIVTSNLYKNLYKQNGLPPKLLGRSLEDSISVTSVLIPWNSCGMTQSTVLGVPTLVYLPYCFFNYLCPLISLAMVLGGHRILGAIVNRTR